MTDINLDKVVFLRSHVCAVLFLQPFGKRSGSVMRNWQLYPKTLGEMARCSKLGSGRACLLTQHKKCLTKVCIIQYCNFDKWLKNIETCKECTIHNLSRRKYSVLEIHKFMVGGECVC